MTLQVMHRYQCVIDPLRVAHVDDIAAALDLDAGLANAEPVQTRLIGYVIGCTSVAVLDQGGNEQGALRYFV